MKSYIIVLLFCSCLVPIYFLFQNNDVPTIEEDFCYLDIQECEMVVDFSDGDANRMMLSPFKEGKILIEFINSENNLLEYDLISGDTQVSSFKHWNKIYSGKTPIFKNKKDSIVWIGGPNRKLFKYNQKNQKANHLPLKYVTRIIPYKSRTYFVDMKGLFYIEDDSTKIQKVKDFPLDYMQHSQLLDDSTLIVEGKITYNLETGTWKDGIHLYDEKISGKSYSFISRQGVGIFKKNKKLFYTTSSGTKKLNLSNRLGSGNLVIRKPYIYGKNQNSIDRFNIETQELASFKYRLPKVNNYGHRVIYNDTIIWIHRPDQLYFINTNTNKKYNYPIKQKDKFKTAIIDRCYIYLLYDKKLVIRDKKEFIANCPKFNTSDYLDELKEYDTFIDSIKITKERTEENVLIKLKEIKERYKDTTHPEVLEKIKWLDYGAFRSVKYENDTDYQICYQNDRLPIEHRIYCYRSLVYRKVPQSDFEQICKYSDDFKSFFQSKNANLSDFTFKQLSYFESKVDALRNYLAIKDSINVLNTSLDTKDYKKAVALIDVCKSSFYCHEGCGGCDFTLVVNALKKFTEDHPNSPFVDNAEYQLLEYKYIPYEDIEDPGIVKDLESFKMKYPDSEALEEAEFRLLNHYLNYSQNEEDKVGLVDKFKSYKAKYPSSSKIKDVEYWIDRLEREKQY